jgi:hypothetical protein
MVRPGPLVQALPSALVSRHTIISSWARVVQFERATAVSASALFMSFHMRMCGISGALEPSLWLTQHDLLHKGSASDQKWQDVNGPDGRWRVGEAGGRLHRTWVTYMAARKKAAHVNHAISPLP